MTTAGIVILHLLLWGMVATLTMTSVMFASQNLGLSRLSLPFLFGSWVTDNRRVANIVGFILYFVGGWFIALFYYFLFVMIGNASWLLGAIAGFIHGLVLLTVFLPLLPYIHPRLASEHDGPDSQRRLEPPGFLALNYGYRTPVVALLAQTIYGAVLGFGIAGVMQ